MEPSELARRLYRTARLVRTLDDRLVDLQREGVLPYFVSSRGEESAIVGAACALETSDWLFPSPRDYGACLARGISVETLFHHFLGTAEDAAHGRQRPNFFGFKAARIGAVSGSVGAHVPHAVGLAWAARVQKDPLAVLCMFGDGATSSGEFHNGANFAGVFKAPIVLVCRNNGHAGSFPSERQCAIESFAEKGVAYGLPSETLRGDDLLAVHHAVAAALGRARRGEGATLIELVTHGADDDPLARAAAALPEGEAARIDDACAGEVEAAFARAKAAPAPHPSTLTTDVFATGAMTEC